CPRLGEGWERPTAANGDVARCYANGVKSQATATTTTIKKANGDLCLQINVMTGGQDYLTPDGAFAGHLAYTASDIQLVATCPDGTVTYVDLTTPACAATVSAMLTCTTGACTY